jgi:hypothetical protein
MNPTEQNMSKSQQFEWQIDTTMSGENRPLHTQLEKFLRFQENYRSFKSNLWNISQINEGKPEDHNLQWKHKDFERLCPKISTDNAPLL